MSATPTPRSETLATSQTSKKKSGTETERERGGGESESICPELGFSRSPVRGLTSVQGPGLAKAKLTDAQERDRLRLRKLPTPISKVHAAAELGCSLDWAKDQLAELVKRRWMRVTPQGHFWIDEEEKSA